MVTKQGALHTGALHTCMNTAILLIGALVLLGARRQEPPKDGEFDPNLPTGTITYDGYWRRYSKWNTSTDYDYVCIIDGFKKDGTPLKVISPDKPCIVNAFTGKGSCSKYDKGRDAWSFSKDPEIAFNDAWRLYQSAGGNTVMNWNLVQTPNYWKYADKEKQRANLLSMVQVFFPNLKLKILNTIPDDLKEKIKIIVPVIG